MDILYAKYNRERLPEFQTETLLYKDNDMLYIRKRGLTKEANNHIRDIVDNYSLLKENLFTNNIVEPKYCEKDNAVCFDYVDGFTLEQLLFEAATDKDRARFFNILGEYKNFIVSIGKTESKTFKPCQKFIEIFGTADSLISKEQVCINIALIDIMFSNLIKTSAGSIHIIDYEWVFACEMPLSFIAFRSINEFLSRYSDYLNNFISDDEIFGFFDIASEELALYKNMEMKFQSYVFGESMPYRLAPKYEKRSEKLKDIYEAYNSYKGIIQSQNARIEELGVWGRQLDAEIAKRDEMIHSQSKKIEELSDYCRNLEKDTVSSENLMHSYNEKTAELNKIYNSRRWRLLQKMYWLESKILPLNSKRRAVLKVPYFVIKNLKLILTHISKENFKKFYLYIRTEGLSRTFTHIKSYLGRFRPVPMTDIKLYAVSDNVYEKFSFTPSPNPLVSIIIPVYNQWNYTYSCLKSIRENTEGIEYEIIIADDVSNDETANIYQYIENIKVIRNSENLKFLLNCNNAAKHAKGKYILFLNNDTDVQKDWLKHLLDLIEKDEQIGMVGSKLVFPDGRLQEAGGIIWNDASGWNYGRLDDPEKAEYNYVKEVDYISGACIMIRSDLWKQIGGFDERFAPAYFEDSDLAFEVRKHGYKVMFQPKSVVVHFEGISNGTDIGSGIKSYQVKNRDKFIEKWQAELNTNHFKNGQNVFSARDRSKNKKTILVIDHYVPHYDKDAGSRTTYEYLKLFSDMGLNVKFLGDNFYKHEPYTSKLQQLGIEVLYGVWYRDNWKQWVKENANSIDYVYLNRPHISIKYIDFLKSNTKAMIIYYGHDLHYLRENRQYEITRDKNILKSAANWKKIEFELFRKADLICYPSEIEINEIKKDLHNVNAKAIPAFIYDESKPECEYIPEQRKNIMFVGGFSHKPNIDAMLWFVKEIFPLVLSEIPDLKFYIIGSNPTDEIKNLKTDNIIVTGFVTDEQLDEYYESCRLTVVPLRYGAGIKGKVVEAMYKQLPVITTAVGAEGLLNADNSLIIADGEEQLSKSIINYYTNAHLLRSVSERAYKYVMDNFTRRNVIDVFSDSIFNLGDEI